MHLKWVALLLMSVTFVNGKVHKVHTDLDAEISRVEEEMQTALGDIEAPSPVKGINDFGDWMGKLMTDPWGRFATKPLWDVYFPGSHDAGTATGRAAAACTHKSLDVQLNNGARVFDLRFRDVDRWWKPDDLLIKHGPVSAQRAIHVVDQIKKYCEETSSPELVLLWVSHTDLDEEGLEQLKDELHRLEKWYPRRWPDSESARYPMSDMTLQGFADNRKRRNVDGPTVVIVTDYVELADELTKLGILHWDEKQVFGPKTGEKREKYPGSNKDDQLCGVYSKNDEWTPVLADQLLQLTEKWNICTPTPMHDQAFWLTWMTTTGTVKSIIYRYYNMFLDMYKNNPKKEEYKEPFSDWWRKMLDTVTRSQRPGVVMTDFPEMTPILIDTVRFNMENVDGCAPAGNVNDYEKYDCFEKPRSFCERNKSCEWSNAWKLGKAVFESNKSGGAHINRVEFESEVQEKLAKSVQNMAELYGSIHLTHRSLQGFWNHRNATTVGRLDDLVNGMRFDDGNERIPRSGEESLIQREHRIIHNKE